MKGLCPVIYYYYHLTSHKQAYFLMNKASQKFMESHGSVRQHTLQGSSHFIASPTTINYGFQFLMTKIQYITYLHVFNADGYEL